MRSKIVLDKAGRVVIPKRIRDELRLGPGDAFELEQLGEEILLRPVRSTVPLFKKEGVWTYRVGHPLTAADTDSVLKSVREDRDAESSTDA